MIIIAFRHSLAGWWLSDGVGMYYPLAFGAGLVYYIGMVQPKTPPISLRVPPDIMTDVDKWAASYKCTRHAALLRLIGLGLGGDAGMMRAYAQERRAKAPEKPLAAKEAPKFRGVTASGEALPERGAYQKKGTKK